MDIRNGWTCLVLKTKLLIRKCHFLPRCFRAIALIVDLTFNHALPLHVMGGIVLFNFNTQLIRMMRIISNGHFVCLGTVTIAVTYHGNKKSSTYCLLGKWPNMTGITTWTRLLVITWIRHGWTCFVLKTKFLIRKFMSFGQGVLCALRFLRNFTFYHALPFNVVAVIFLLHVS